MPGQAYYKKSARAASSERNSTIRPRPDSCSSIYSLYDENDVPPEIKAIMSMSKEERYPPRPIHAVKAKSQRVTRKTKVDNAPGQQETEKSKVELSKSMTQGQSPLSPGSSQQNVLTRELDRSTQENGGEDQSAVNTAGSKIILPPTQIIIGSIYSEIRIEKPPVIIGRQIDLPPPTDELTNEQKSITRDRTMGSRSSHFKISQPMILTKVEPAQLDIKPTHPIPTVPQSSIKAAHIQTTRTAIPSMNTGYSHTAGLSTTSSPDPSTASLSATQGLASSTTPDQFVRGISQPFPPSKTLGGYPQYPYSQRHNYITDSSSGTPCPNPRNQLEHIEHFTPEGDMVTHATKNIHDESLLERTSQLHGAMMMMGSEGSNSVWKEREEGKRARKKAICKSMISAPIAIEPDVSDERRAVSEVIVPKEDPPKGNIWLRALRRRMA